MENMVGDIFVHPAVDFPQNTLFYLGVTQVPTDHHFLSVYFFFFFFFFFFRLTLSILLMDPPVVQAIR